MEISIVIPCYNTRQCLGELHRRLQATLLHITNDYEIIYVDDGSPQHDFEEIKELTKSEKRVKLIMLSRNFGQQAAISAGLNHASGKWIVTMDADLQDRPEEIINLYAKVQEGYDAVYAIAKERSDSFIKRSYSRLFHSLFAYLTDNKTIAGMRNFGIYSKKVIDAFLLLDEQYRGFALLVRWLGFNTTTIEIHHERRVIGKSSYNFSKGLNLALEAWLTFSDKPLRITVAIGFAISMMSFLAGVVFLLRSLLGFKILLGWTSLILSIWFLGGFTIFSIGLIGLYIGKVFNEAKKRPHFIIAHTENFDEEL